MLYLLITSVIGVTVLNTQATGLFDSEKENSPIPNVKLLGSGRNVIENSGILRNEGSSYLNESHELIKNNILLSSNGPSCQQRDDGNIKMHQYPLIDLGNKISYVDLKSQSDKDSTTSNIFLKKTEDKKPLTEPVLVITESKGSKFKLISRDRDTFHDDDLFVKINDDEASVNNLHVDSRNEDSYLTARDKNRKVFLNRIDKRASETSHHSDYNYYDKKGDGTSVKDKFTNIKRIFMYKNNTDNTIVSDVLNSTRNDEEILTDSLEKHIIKQTEATIDLKEKEPKRDESLSSTNDQKKKNSLTNPSELAHQEIKYDGHDPLDDGLGEISKLDHKDECGIISEQRSNDLRIKTRGRGEMANCLPSGGLPKYQTLSFSPKKNDSFYEKIIQGDLVDKFHRAVLDKLSRNSKMVYELGITSADTRDVRDLYNRIRCKDTYCCKKVIEELECFLTWILTVDTSRRKRSTAVIAADGKVHLLSSCGSKMGSCEDYINDYTQSPEYKKLFENVEKYKESSANSWNYDSFNMLSDSSKK